MEDLHTPNCIRTHSGIYMNVFEPTLDMICIEDIAHALSNQCRFGGHLPNFYSVAQHSILCSMGVDQKYKLQALMHDASEAYILDFPTPIKKNIPQYKEIEDKLMVLIAEKFGFNYPFDKEIKMIDNKMLEFEWNHLMLGKELPYKFECYTPERAESIFLTLFYELS